MTLSDVSIQRPVLTWMMMLALVVAGALGVTRLGVDQFPPMEFPVVMVVATLEGANPEGMEEDVTDVLEENLNTIAGVRELRSTTLTGVSQIFVEFQLGTNLDKAIQDVRDEVAKARRNLPKETEPPTVSKTNFSDQPILWIPFSSHRPEVETSEYVRRTVKPLLETIPGVGGVVGVRPARPLDPHLDRRRGAALARPRCHRRRERAAPRARRHPRRPGRGLARRVDREDRRRVPLDGSAGAHGGRAEARRARVPEGRRAHRGRRGRHPRAGALPRRADGRARRAQADGRKHRRDRRRSESPAREAETAAARGHHDRRRARLHRFLPVDPGVGRRDGVRARVRRAARGADGVRVPAAHAAHPDRRHGDSRVTHHHLRAGLDRGLHAEHHDAARHGARHRRRDRRRDHRAREHRAAPRDGKERARGGRRRHARRSPSRPPRRRSRSRRCSCRSCSCRASSATCSASSDSRSRAR